MLFHESAKRRWDSSWSQAEFARVLVTLFRVHYNEPFLNH